MKVLRDLILVKEPLEEEKVTSGGIIVATESKNSYNDTVVNEVVGVGNKVQEVLVGNKVMYLPREGTIVKKTKGANFRILREEDIMALVDEEDFQE